MRGGRIAESARVVLREVDAIHDIAKSSQDPFSGTFRLGAFPTLSTYLFPDLVVKIRDAMPNLRLVLIEEKTATLLELLQTGEIDAAFLALPVKADFLICQKLFDDEFYLAVPPDHELAGRDSIDQKNLKNRRLLLLEEGHCLRDQALEVCQLNGLTEEEDFRATGMETLRYMVKAGTGITLIP